jgi:hypothetical protein
MIYTVPDRHKKAENRRRKQKTDRRGQKADGEIENWQMQICNFHFAIFNFQFPSFCLLPSASATMLVLVLRSTALIFSGPAPRSDGTAIGNTAWLLQNALSAR